MENLLYLIGLIWIIHAREDLIKDNSLSLF